MALIPPTTPSTTPLRDAIRSLLPPGPPWAIPAQRLLQAYVDGMIVALDAARNAVRVFADQVFPARMTYMTDDWSREVDIAWPCQIPPADQAEARARIAARLAAQGGQTAAYLVEVAAALGVSVNIIEIPKGVPARFGLARCGIDRFGSEAQLFEFEVQAPASTPSALRTQLECVIEAFKPAHTVAIHTYTL